MKKKIAILGMATVMSLAPMTAFAAAEHEYTPVLPRVSGYKGLVDNRGLELYTGDDNIGSSNYYNSNNGNNANMNSLNRNSLNRSNIDLIDNNVNDIDNNTNTGINRSSYFRLGESLTEDSLSNDTTTNNTTNGTTTNAADDYSTEDKLITDNNSSIIDESQSTSVKVNLIESIGEVNNIKVNGELPQFVNLSNTEYQQRLNQEIKDSFSNLVSAGYKNIKTKFEVFNFANLTSLVIYYEVSNSTTNANMKQIVKTFVIDNVGHNEVTLKNLIGDDYIAVVNEHINTVIKADKGKYYQDENKFETIKSNQNFYVKSGEIIIVFDEYTIAPGATGTPMFTIPYDNTITIKLGTNEYFTENAMDYIPLTALLRLGMSIESGMGGTIKITSSSSETLAYLSANSTNFSDSKEFRLVNGFNIQISTDFAESTLGLDISKEDNQLTLISVQ